MTGQRERRGSLPSSLHIWDAPYPSVGRPQLGHAGAYTILPLGLDLMSQAGAAGRQPWVAGDPPGVLRDHPNLDRIENL